MVCPLKQEENKFGCVALISSLRCCGACYARLHRLSPSVNKSVSQPPSANNSIQNQVGHPPVSYELASKRAQRRIRNKLKNCAREQVAELKTEVENMGASNEEICQEILEGQFDGIQLTFIFSNKTFLFLTHIVKFHLTYSTLFGLIFGLIMKR